MSASSTSPPSRAAAVRQAGAVRHGISRALAVRAWSPAPKAGGFLTRDPRVVERKKYGKAKARWSVVLKALVLTQKILNIFNALSSDSAFFLEAQ